MVLDAFKKYPSQISSAFRRFPVATGFALFTFIALIAGTEITTLLGEEFKEVYWKLILWLGVFPIAAMLISLTTSLVQESLKKHRKDAQLIAGAIWLIISDILIFNLSDDKYARIFGTEFTFYSIFFIYVIVTLGLFIAPFWKQKNENAFWIFTFKNIKALIVGALIASVLLGSIEALVFAFGQLFDYEFNEKIFLYIFYFCAGFVFPILYFSGIPSIEECHNETPTLNKFATSTIKFLFFPVLSLAILLFYAYIVKFIVLWDMPKGLVSYFVTGFMIYMLALVTIMYPTRLGTEHTFEKKLLKIFPTACIPLVIMMSVGLIRRISEYGISELRIYAVIVNIFFYTIIAIFLIDKIKCKSRYIAVIFCALLFVFTVTPMRASNISHYVWMESIKAALVEQGYTKYPLSREDSRAFVKELRKKDDVTTLLIVSRMKELASRPHLDFREYLDLAAYDDAFSDDLIEASCCGDSTDAEPFDSFETSIEYPDKAILQVPPGTKGAVAIDHYFDNDEFEFTGDTLTFRLSLKEDSGCSCNSDKSDACEETPVPVYSFTVDRQTLMQDSVRQIKADKATIAINYLYAEETSKKDKSLRIKGILFTK